MIYEITGFGGSYWDALYQRAPPPAAGETEFIRVLLDGQCQWGHHVYADGPTNGPRGLALVEELIPGNRSAVSHDCRAARPIVGGAQLRRMVELVAANLASRFFRRRLEQLARSGRFPRFSASRFVCHAAAELVLQRARQAAADCPHRPAAGAVLPLVRKNGRRTRPRRAAALVRGRVQPAGRQWLAAKSFGTAARDSIDPEVAQAWEKYDIRLQLERNWKTLEPHLRGKLHITVGSLDTFYLESRCCGSPMR